MNYSYKMLKTKDVNISKPHKCNMCDTIVKPPAVMHTQPYTQDGDIRSTYSCQCCNSFMAEGTRWADCDNEIIAGEIWLHDEYALFRDNFYKIK